MKTNYYNKYEHNDADNEAVGIGDVSFERLLALMSLLWGILNGLVSQNLTALPAWIGYLLVIPLTIVLVGVAGRITATSGGFWRVAGGMLFLSLISSGLVIITVGFLRLLGVLP